MSRLDLELFARGLFKSREKSKYAIEEGLITVDGVKVIKPSFEVTDKSIIEILGNQIQYIGRGGLKLEGALNHFNIVVSGLNIIDVGASTGGFTDCLLRRGAASVYAVDVGHGQLDQELIGDARVVNLEGTDIRQFAPVWKGELFDFATIDVSFISLEKVLPSVYSLIKPSAPLICLVKPQFEAGRSALNKRGIVRDQKVREACVEKIRAVAVLIGFEDVGYIVSPITGGDGNVEFLLYLKKK